jgi:hypothetical protein
MKTCRRKGLYGHTERYSLRTKRLLPGILELKIKEPKKFANVCKGSRFSKWWEQGCVRKINFDPLLLIGCRSFSKRTNESSNQKKKKNDNAEKWSCRTRTPKGIIFTAPPEQEAISTQCIFGVIARNIRIFNCFR